MTLADSHIHLFANGYSHDGVRSPFGSGELAAYEALRSKYKIELALAIGYEADGIDPENNAYIRRLSITRKWLRTVAYVDANRDAAADAVEALLDQGHCGIALYVTNTEKARNVLRWPLRIWEVLRMRRAIVSLNARPEAIALLHPLLEAAAGVPFLFSHLGLPGRLSPDIDTETLRNCLAPLVALARLDNALVKISGLYAVSDPPFGYPHRAAVCCIREILAAFGSKRCLWGSDFPPAMEFVSFPQTIQWEGTEGLSEKERGLIMRDNLVQLLGVA